MQVSITMTLDGSVIAKKVFVATVLVAWKGEIPRLLACALNIDLFVIIFKLIVLRALTWYSASALVKCTALLFR